MSIVNNVTRLLDARKIPYTAYELSPEKRGAQETARLLNVDPASIFKTIVVLRDKAKKPLLVLVSGDSVVDLKLLASALGEKKVYLPTEKEAEQITGLQAGGISPLSLLNKGFQVILDSAVENFEQIHVSGGQRGLNIKLPVTDLIRLTNARVELVRKQDTTME
ncbi:MAG TPA: YbaK/EbsC family protein [Anaerolineales bacterium]|nr:YbaK/EbsC family protein [Anaerolineales bacterium]